MEKGRGFVFSLGAIIFGVKEPITAAGRRIQENIESRRRGRRLALPQQVNPFPQARRPAAVKLLPSQTARSRLAQLTVGQGQIAPDIIGQLNYPQAKFTQPYPMIAEITAPLRFRLRRKKPRPEPFIPPIRRAIFPYKSQPIVPQIDGIIGADNRLSGYRLPVDFLVGRHGRRRHSGRIQRAQDDAGVVIDPAGIDRIKGQIGPDGV